MEKPEQAAGHAGTCVKSPTDEANGGETVMFSVAPARKEDVATEDMLPAWECYRTSRCQKDTAPSYATTSGLTQLVAWDAFTLVDLFLTQPLLLIAGKNAGNIGDRLSAGKLKQILG